MRRIVSVIGTDGSGKTTLSDQVVELLVQQGLRSERVWLGAESRLMGPARSVLKLFWKRRPAKSDPSSRPAAAYGAEIAKKNKLASRHPYATRLYLFLALADYKMQITAKLWSHRRQDVIVADRYVFDVAVNIGLTLGWTPSQVVTLAQRQLARFPTPQVRVFLRVEPEVSLSRKDDIPDIDYLRLRLRYYDAIAQAFGFSVYDGTLPIDENSERLLALVNDEFEKPYVHYVHANNTDVGGADKVLALMATHAQTPAGVAAPYRVSVSLRQPTDIVSSYISAGIPVLLRPFVRPQVSGRIASVLSTATRAPSTFWHFWRLLSREQPDVVHVNDLYDFLPAIAAKSQRIPVVYHLRMIKTNRYLRSGFASMIPRLAGTSISVSEAVRHHYFPDRLANHRAEVVHDLANASLAAYQPDQSRPDSRPPALDGPGRVVVMVGRIEPWKGQDVFLNAVRKLDVSIRTSHTFVLVGGAVPGQEAFFAETRDAAATLGVRFLGERADVPDLLRATDVSVHCSTAPDPFPGVVIESLLAGAATVGANAGGVPEIIASPTVGILYPPGDSAALARELTILLTMADAPRDTYGVAGRLRGLELTDPEVIDRQVSSIYQREAPKARLALGLSAPKTLKG